MREGVKMNERLKKSRDIADWIASKFDGIGVVRDGRSEFAATCYYVVWQHQAAVSRVYQEGLIAPATALLRCAWDAYIRGMWLSRAAGDEAVAAFLAGGSPPPQKEIVAALEVADELPPDILSAFHRAHYSELCDLTHTGIAQLLQQWNDEETCARQEPEQVESILEFVDSIALSSLAQAAVMANEQLIAHEALERMSAIRRR